MMENSSGIISINVKMEFVSFAERKPEKSGWYIVRTNNGNFAEVHYSKVWELFNQFDDSKDSRLGWNESQVVYWATSPKI